MKNYYLLPLLSWLLLALGSQQAEAASLGSPDKKDPPAIQSTHSASGTTGAANSGTLMKIAVIDFRQVMQQSKLAKELSEKIKKQFQTRAEKIKSLKTEYEKKEAKFKKDSAVMTADERRSTQSDLVAQSRDLQHLIEDYQQDLNNAQDQALQDLLGKVNKIVNKIAEKEHYDLILDKNRLPFVTAKLDITDQLVKEMNS